MKQAKFEVGFSDEARQGEMVAVGRLCQSPELSRQAIHATPP